MMNTMGIVFANIYDSSLGGLTNKRTMASLPFGGRYRQIDFCLSNLANAGITHIGIITKYNYQSLMSHIGSGQEWDLELGEGQLEMLPPFARGHNSSYRGKLEALHSAFRFLELSKEEYVILTDGAVLANMDLREIVDHHVESGNDVTVVVKRGICNGEKQIDLAVKLDGENRITDMVVDLDADDSYVASAGIYVMKRELLMDATKRAVAHSRYRMERDFILREFNTGEITVGVFDYRGIALFNESTEEYYRNNLALLDREVRRGLFNPDRNIYTRVRNEVPALIGENAEADNCIVSDGCVIDGVAVHSVLFRGVQLHCGARVEDCVIMQDAVIEEGAELKCCVLDKDVHVRRGSKLTGTYDHPIIVERGETI